MIDTLSELQVVRKVEDGRSIWTTEYRGAKITVAVEFESHLGAMAHRVFIDEPADRPVALGTEPPPTIYKSIDAAGEAGLRRAMAFLDRSPADRRSSSDF